MDDRQSAIRRRICYGCCIVFPVLLAVFCAVGFIVCFVFVVKPVVWTGSLEFKETNCTTTSSFYTGRLENCESCLNCQVSCNNCNGNVRYPCLVIKVNYRKNGQEFPGNLFETEARLDRSSAMAAGCVTSPTCERNDDYTREKVERFRKAYGVGKTYKCLYHPGGSSSLLLRRQFTQQSVIHSMLWTSVGLVLFFGIAVFMCCQCKKAGDQLMTMAAPGAGPASSAPPQAIPIHPLSHNNPYAHAPYQNPAVVPGLHPEHHYSGK